VYASINSERRSTFRDTKHCTEAGHTRLQCFPPTSLAAIQETVMFHFTPAVKPAQVSVKNR